MTPAPPYRVRTRAEIRAYAERVSRARGSAMLGFAGRHPLVIPPVLERLAPQVSVPLYRTAARRRRPDDRAPATLPCGLRSDLIRAAVGAPEGYGDALALVVAAGQRSLRPRSGRRAFSDEPGLSLPQLAEIRRLLWGSENLPHVLAEAVRVYANTRSDNARTFLRQALCLLLLYARGGPDPRAPRRLDLGLAEAIRALDPEEERDLPPDIHDTLVGRLRANRFEYFRPCYGEFLRRFRQGVHRIRGLPPNLKTNTFAVMKKVVSGEVSVGRAREDLRRIFENFEANVPGEARTRYRSVTQNFLEKIERVNDLIGGLFQARGRETPCGGGGGLWNPSHEIVVERALLDASFLTCYPTKDYLDLWKGEAGGDCTVREDLAARHLAHPRFFNLRVFHRKVHVGNVYALDFTDRSVPTVVLDKVQFAQPRRWLPGPTLWNLLEAIRTELFRGVGTRLIAPAVGISNSEYIRSRYLHSVRGMPRVSFRMTAAENSFESSKGTSFVCLREAETVGQAATPGSRSGPARNDRKPDGNLAE